MNYAPIFQIVAADPAATSLLGTLPTRLYPFGEAPAGVSLPYGVWQLISGSPENYLAGRPDIDGFTLQIDIYAATASSARDTAGAIRHAIELDAYVTGYNGEMRDDDTGHYRVSFDVDWLIPR